MGEGSAAPRVLVTGGTGFIGYRLVARMVGDGGDVHVVIREGTDPSALAALSPRPTVHRHDGSTEGMDALVGEARPDLVFHLASLFLARHGPGDVAPLIGSNVLFGAQLVEAMTRHGAGRLVNAGTSWQNFGSRDYRPVCLYAATKQAFEDILAYYVDATPLRAVSLRLCDTYGSADRRGKLFHLLRTAAAAGRRLDMSPGDQRIDLVHVDDAVEAFLAAGRRLMEGRPPAPHEVFAVSSGRPIRLRDLVETYARVTGKKVDVAWGGIPYRPREVMEPWTLGSPVPGWSPRIGLEEGIREMEGGG